MRLLGINSVQQTPNLLAPGKRLVTADNRLSWHAGAVTRRAFAHKRNGEQEAR